MIRNKAADAKCVACQHEMYKSDDVGNTEDSRKASAFGDKAFKPTSAAPSKDFISIFFQKTLIFSRFFWFRCCIVDRLQDTVFWIHTRFVDSRIIA